MVVLQVNTSKGYSRRVRDWFSLLAVFIAAALLVLATCRFAPLSAQIATLGLLISLVLTILLVQLRRTVTPEVQAELLTIPLALARDSAIFEQYREFADALRNVSTNADPIYRTLSIQRTAEMAHELRRVGEGHIVFRGTETWRMVYAQLLRSPGLHLYRSIALVKTANYWQDEPGRQSIRLNLELMRASRLDIERIVILADPLWPAEHRFPIEPLHSWILDQFDQGVEFGLVRLSAIAKEPDLAADLGIYGNRAVGYQELDEHGRTVRFTLTFDFGEVLAAEGRWERLSVYATSYRDILEQGVAV